MLNVQESLYTKSWLIHIIMMFSRIVYPILGIAYWQKAYKGKDKLDEQLLNQDFVDKSEPVIKIILISLIPIGVLLDILICRRRHLANLLFYYEMISILLQGFVPFDFGDFGMIMLLMLMIQTYITVACDLSRNVICCTVISLIMMLG